MSRYINPYKLFQGCIIPNWLLRRTEVSSTAKLAYGRLIQYAGRDGLAYPSYATMAKELAVSGRQTIRLVSELIEAGLLEAISRERDDGGISSNAYRFIDHPWMRESSDEGDTTPVTQPSEAPLSFVSPKENHSEENPLISFDTYPKDFEDIWKIYPRRSGSNPKNLAYAKYKQIPKSKHPPSTIQDGVQRYRAFCLATDKIGTEYVMQGQKFFGSGGYWAEAWEIPAPKPTYANKYRGEQYEQVKPPPFLEK